jgi:D-sedoheptulose 7-phosphate isomerase
VSRGMDYETLTKEFAQEYNSVSFHHYS